MLWREMLSLCTPLVPKSTSTNLGFYPFILQGLWDTMWQGCHFGTRKEILRTPPGNRASTKIRKTDIRIQWQRPVHSRRSCKCGPTLLVETVIHIPVFNLAFRILCEKSWQSLIIITPRSWTTHMAYNHISIWFVSISWKHLEFPGLHGTNSLTKQ